MDANMDWPRYSCHKIVSAIKIRQVAETTIWPEDHSISAYQVSRNFLAKHNPRSGGYLVLYEDGYLSYSPPKPFEDGYTLIE